MPNSEKSREEYLSMKREYYLKRYGIKIIPTTITVRISDDMIDLKGLFN